MKHILLGKLIHIPWRNGVFSCKFLKRKLTRTKCVLSRGEIAIMLDIWMSLSIISGTV